MKVLVMGTGSYYQKKKAGLQSDIIAFVDNFKEGEYEGKEIIRPVDISKYSYDRIYIMSVHFISMGYQLLELGVAREKIYFGANTEPYNDFERNFISENNQIVINVDNKICYKTPEIEIAVNTFDKLYGVKDIFWENTYRFSVSENKKKIVIDIGSNIGASCAYFAQFDNVEEIYGYEPFTETYKLASYNLSKYNDVHLKQCAIGTEEKKETVLFNPGMTCGMSVINEVNEHAHKMYGSWGYIKEDENVEETIQIIDVVKECSELFEKHKNMEFVLKMDCEGSEYEILEKMNNSNILKQFKVIMLEWHYKDASIIEKYLKENGFSFFSFNKNNNMGTIYGIR